MHFNTLFIKGIDVNSKANTFQYIKCDRTLLQSIKGTYVKASLKPVQIQVVFIMKSGSGIQINT